MSKLFKLKEWLTVPDAARHLSIVFGEEITEADVLRLALDGHMNLSVNFVNFAMAYFCNVVPFSEARIVPGFLFEGQEPYKVCLDQHLNNQEVLQIGKEIVQIEGVWDLLMVGGERLDVEHKYQQLTGGVDVALVHMAGTFVKGANGQICQIQSRDNDNEDSERANEVRPWNHPDMYRRAEGLPKDSVLVVRTDALRKLEESINDISASAEKLMTSTERNTLLTIIATLCDYSDIKYQERGAAGQIAKLTEEIGAPVSDDTIRNVFAKISDALESRKK